MALSSRLASFNCRFSSATSSAELPILEEEQASEPFVVGLFLHRLVSSYSFSLASLGVDVGVGPAPRASPSSLGLPRLELNIQLCLADVFFERVPCGADHVELVMERGSICPNMPYRYPGSRSSPKRAA